MSGVLRVTRLNGLLRAQVNSDRNDGQDADVPETSSEINTDLITIHNNPKAITLII